MLLVRSLSGLAVATFVAGSLAACGGVSDSTSNGLPGGAVKSNQIVLSNIQPNDGVTPVVQFIESATKTLDMYMYEFEAQYQPVVDALLGVQKKGVKVRILLSLRETGQEPDATNDNHQAAKILTAQGLDVQFSRPEFYVSHAKAIILDAGESTARAMISDFNIGQGYFGAPTPDMHPYPGQGGARGMAVINSDPADIANLSATFNADWPPYSQWPAADRPNLVWAPSGEKYTNPGNAATAMKALIEGADKTLDIYAQEISANSELLPSLLDRAGQGVAVRIIGNRSGIAPQAVSSLQSKGVQLVERPQDPNNPALTLFIHTKTILVDSGSIDAVTFVGSENSFQDASLYTERELGAFVTDPDSIAKMQATFNQDFSTSEAYHE